MSELRNLIARHSRGEITRTAVPRLTLGKCQEKMKLSSVIYPPLFCVIAQGQKQIFLGTEEFHYNPDTYLIASVDLPVTSRVIEAPCLGCSLALDLPTLASLVLELPPSANGSAASRAMAVHRLEDDLSEPLLRLIRLLDTPQDIPVLAPLIEREILYRLLLGPRGKMLRRLAQPDSQMAQISRVIDVIRRRYDRSIRIEELAQIAGMSSTSLHRHFRAVTALSPLQFQKQIRLQEARRILLSTNADAASVGFEVGYESASQFSREYRRLFGVPPGRDTIRARQSFGRPTFHLPAGAVQNGFAAVSGFGAGSF
jgi:AraC-like DNA-binding protein